jgi:hypothetical protein
VAAVGYNSECVQCVTWGGVRLVTWQFIETYCEEGFAVFGHPREPNIRVFRDPDGDRNGDDGDDDDVKYLRQEMIELPGPPPRDLETAIDEDTARLRREPRWGMGSRIWIDRPPPGHWEYVP